MLSQESLQTVLSFVKDLPSKLNQPVRMPAFLLTPIALPSGFSLGRRRPGRAKRREARSPEKAKQAQTSDQFALSGIIETGMGTIYSVQGKDFIFDSDTWIFGDISLGAYARVKGSLRAGERYASHIVIGNSN